MGELYRARDTRLDRDVAIKVLPAEFAWDHDRLSFQESDNLWYVEVLSTEPGVRPASAGDLLWSNYWW